MQRALAYTHDPRRCADGCRMPAPVVEVVVLPGDCQRQTLQCLSLVRNETSHHLTILHGNDWQNSIGAHRRDVVLVGAGSVPFDYWLDRLCAAAYSQAEVGTASPFSNAGKLCAYPFPGHQDSTQLWDWKALDRIASEENREARLVIPEPGSGCVYLRRDYLDQVSAGQPGKRPRQHVLAADTCVYQFRDDAAMVAALMGLSCQAVSEPVRQAAFSSHLQADPGRMFRRNIDLGRLRGTHPAMLLITHVGGGGTERHVREMAERLEREGIRAIILRPTAKGCLRLERYAVPCTPSLVYEPAQEYYVLLQALRHLGLAHVHVHHLLGHPTATERLLADLALPYDWTIHDYFTICPRIALMDGHGSYCGEPGPESCNRCLATHGRWGDVRDGTEIGRWRARYAPMLRGARRVFVPHPDVGRRMRRYLPDVEFVVREHTVTLLQGRTVAVPLNKDKPLRIAVLGTLLPQKGVHVLTACARDALQRDLPMHFQVIGTAHPHEQLAAFGNVEISGEYTEEEVFDLLESQECHCALCLSIVPETYSFTLSITQSAGLYTIGFDLGAQGARITESGWGEVVPLDTPPAKINDRLLALRERLHGIPPRPAPRFAEYANLLRDYFGLDQTCASICGHPSTTLEEVNTPRRDLPHTRFMQFASHRSLPLCHSG